MIDASVNQIRNGMKKQMLVNAFKDSLLMKIWSNAQDKEQ